MYLVVEYIIQDHRIYRDHSIFHDLILYDMKVFIQNMVSKRCKMMVQKKLEELEILYISVELGEVYLKNAISDSLKRKLSIALHHMGLEVIYDKKDILIEKITLLIIEAVHNENDVPKTNFSDYLSRKLLHNYHYLAALFSKAKGITIEHFMILHKVERIKELIMYNEMNLTEISYRMHYSSVSHLSKQFKKTTGLTPSYFRNLELKKRSSIEDLH
jgi:AraC-like DNA-binding protein